MWFGYTVNTSIQGDKEAASHGDRTGAEPRSRTSRGAATLICREIPEYCSLYCRNCIQHFVTGRLSWKLSVAALYYVIYISEIYFEHFIRAMGNKIEKRNSIHYKFN